MRFSCGKNSKVESKMGGAHENKLLIICSGLSKLLQKVILFSYYFFHFLIFNTNTDYYRFFCGKMKTKNTPPQLHMRAARWCS